MLAEHHLALSMDKVKYFRFNCKDKKPVIIQNHVVVLCSSWCKFQVSFYHCSALLACSVFYCSLKTLFTCIHILISTGILFILTCKTS